MMMSASNKDLFDRSSTSSTSPPGTSNPTDMMVRAIGAYCGTSRSVLADRQVHNCERSYNHFRGLTTNIRPRQTLHLCQPLPSIVGPRCREFFGERTLAILNQRPIGFHDHGFGKREKCSPTAVV